MHILDRHRHLVDRAQILDDKVQRAVALVDDLHDGRVVRLAARWCDSVCREHSCGSISWKFWPGIAQILTQSTVKGGRLSNSLTQRRGAAEMRRESRIATGCLHPASPLRPCASASNRAFFKWTSPCYCGEPATLAHALKLRAAATMTCPRLMQPSLGGVCRCSSTAWPAARSRAASASVSRRFWKQPPLNATRGCADRRCHVPRRIPPARRENAPPWLPCPHPFAHRRAVPLPAAPNPAGGACPPRPSPPAAHRAAARRCNARGAILKLHRGLALKGDLLAQPDERGHAVEEAPHARRHRRVDAAGQHGAEQAPLRSVKALHRRQGCASASSP